MIPGLDSVLPALQTLRDTLLFTCSALAILLRAVLGALYAFVLRACGTLVATASSGRDAREDSVMLAALASGVLVALGGWAVARRRRRPAKTLTATDELSSSSQRAALTPMRTRVSLTPGRGGGGGGDSVGGDGGGGGGGGSARDRLRAPTPSLAQLMRAHDERDDAARRHEERGGGGEAGDDGEGEEEEDDDDTAETEKDAALRDDPVMHGALATLRVEWAAARRDAIARGYDIDSDPYLSPGCQETAAAAAAAASATAPPTPRPPPSGASAAGTDALLWRYFGGTPSLTRLATD